MTEKKKLNLALQGGGSHGAFTWGALNRILEDERLDVVAISGSSAGAINGAVLIDGYVKDGRKGALEHLERLWRQISDRQSFNVLSRTPFEKMTNGWNLDKSLSYQMWEGMTEFFSPYAFNPLNFNPLKGVLEELLSLENMKACNDIELFVTATRVYNGHPRVFSHKDINVDVLLASACIPQLFQAVEIEGEPYWDGGYMGNPSIWPLIYKSPAEDVLLVQINPLVRTETPKTVLEIHNRLNEISFNASLISEMRAIAFVSRLLKEDRLERDSYRDMRMHMIEKPQEMMSLNATSKFNCEWEFLTYLRDLGYKTADKWLEDNYKKIGTESSVPIYETFLKA